MKKQITIISTTVLVFFLAVLFIFLYLQKKPQSKISRQQNQQQHQQQSFVIDVDLNIDHWQTKETEFFTIKFPKEWYWMESDIKKTGYHSRVITNNPDFNINKYADIGVFTGGRYLYFSESEGGAPRPLQLSDTEVVISFNGSATSDAGTPQDRIDSIFKLTKQSDPVAKCSIYNNKTIPFTMYCSSTHDSELQQSYYVINKEISITFTARTTKDTSVKKEIFDKIVGSITLK